MTAAGSKRLLKEKKQKFGPLTTLNSCRGRPMRAECGLPHIQNAERLGRLWLLPLHELRFRHDMH